MTDRRHVFKDNPNCKYLVLADDLKMRIARRQIEGQLPPLRQLMVEYGVSKGTVTNALRVLRVDRVIWSIGGSGNYVRKSDFPRRDARQARKKKKDTLT